MTRDLLEEIRLEGEGKTPGFLKLAFLLLILWAMYYLWKNLPVT
jgi:hypothetical protein